MQYAEFNSVCPFEINDFVNLVSDGKVYSKEVYKIIDILCVHSIRSNKVIFQFILVDQFYRQIKPRGIDDIKIFKEAQNG
jgi:hypothetical protein